MARTNKIGLEYFPFDVDFFNDIKIRKLIRSQGGKAVTVYVCLLGDIYKNGYFMRWDKDLPFIISEKTGYDEVYIQEVINSCLDCGLFSKELHTKNGILTSKGIQIRYSDICELLRRKSKIEDYNLINVEEIPINVEEIPINVEEIPINVTLMQQKKVNKTKVNNTPLTPLSGGDGVVVEKTLWRDNFEMYLTDLRTAYRAAVIDTAYMTERAKYHPGLNIKLSLEKACKEFWATEAGWKHKKKTKSNDLNWKSTFTKALDLKSNQVWLQKGEQNETEESRKKVAYV